jgi:hypothetical protein
MIVSPRIKMFFYDGYIDGSDFTEFDGTVSLEN